MVEKLPLEKIRDLDFDLILLIPRIDVFICNVSRNDDDDDDDDGASCKDDTLQGMFGDDIIALFGGCA